MTKLTREAVKSLGLSVKESDRCRNFFAMGLVYWLYGRDMEATLRFIHGKFSKTAEIAQANESALKAGWAFGETTETLGISFRVEAAQLPPASIVTSWATSAGLGFDGSGSVERQKLVYGSYPITPASDILHELCKYKNFGICTFQAEDEIAAICSALGASYGGAMGVTTSSGPGNRAQGRGHGPGCDARTTLLIIDVQRGGPSTGLPTKTEQADLLQVLFGRNGEAPMPVLAAAVLAIASTRPSKLGASLLATWYLWSYCPMDTSPMVPNRG